MMSIYDITVTDAQGKEVSLSDYKGKTMLIVNTASKCGFTPQYDDLQDLYDKWKDKGFEVLAFPCDQFANQEPGTNAEIQKFCEINFDLTYPVFAKLEVNGPNAHPLYKLLREKEPGLAGSKIKWNFTKFLVDAEGNVLHRYAPATKPARLSPVLERLFAEKK
jgi:glutathione peroxidase